MFGDLYHIRRASQLFLAGCYSVVDGALSRETDNPAQAQPGVAGLYTLGRLPTSS